MLGKKKCRILKEIRQKIADENDIPYVTHECKFQGECKGTCPRCESELRYLEDQLAARAAAGKRVAIAALCAGMAFGMAGCTTPFSDSRSGVEDVQGMMEGPEEVTVTTGEIAPPDDTGELEDPKEQEGTKGQEDPEEQVVPIEVELSGDVAFIEEEPSR